LVTPDLGIATNQIVATDDWAALHAETGGDFNSVPEIRDRLPDPVSIYLEWSLVAALAEELRRGRSLVDAIHRLLVDRPSRLIHWFPLDVLHDPGLRVLQVVTSLQRGGAERIAIELATGLPSWGIRSRLVALGMPTREAFPKPAATIDLSNLTGGRSARWPALQRAAAIHAADLIHCHLLEAGDVADVAALGLPVVLTIHNARPGWPRGLDKLPGETATLMLACSRAVEADLRAARLPDSIRTVWNGIDFAPFAPTAKLHGAASEFRRQQGFGSNDFVLAALANPRPQKRLERLPSVLAATRSALARCAIEREARLVIVGESSNSSESARQSSTQLQAEIDRLGLAAHARVIGPRSDIAGVLAAADVLVSASAYEGLSLAHLEALAAGLQVVATDAGGTAEIARGNPAMHVLPLEACPEEFAAKLVQCATSPSEGGRTAAAVHFSWQRMLERHAFLYPRALATACPTRSRSGLFLVINNFSTGGAQSSARRLLLGLAAEGIPVGASVLEEEANNPTPGLKSLQSAGVPVLVLPRAGTLDPAVAVCRLLEHIDSVGPAVVLFWNAIAQYKVLLADALLDVPIFDISPGEMYYSSLETYFARPRPGLPYRDAKEYGARLAGLIVKYRREADQAARTMGAPVLVIPNGVPLGEPIQRQRQNGDPLVFGTTARISAQKKLDELLAAFHKAHKRLPPYLLTIAGGVERGNGSHAQELKRLSNGLPVHWVGELADVRPFLRTLDVFVMIAEPAGCPNSSLEAMAEGLPVISTDVGGMSEQIVDGVTGRLVPRGDTDGFADALVDTASCPERPASWGGAARSHIAEQFSLERMIAHYRRVCIEPYAVICD
jgi:glycosyltransferase involved in cell wall biosynthesis